MRLSIAMATYNGAGYIEEQLCSIAGQSRQPDELIIYDDASTDGTPELIEQFRCHVPFAVKLFRNNTNIGSTKTFEKAIRASSGDVVFLCDQDDVWRCDKLEKMSDRFIEDPSCMAVLSNARLTDSQGNASGVTLWETIGLVPAVSRKLEEGGAAAFRTLLKENYVTGAVFAFRAHWVDLFLPIPSVWIHDAWIALLLSALGPLRLIPETLIDYRQHESNQIGLRPRPIFRRLRDRTDLESGLARMNCLLAHMNASGLIRLQELAPIVEAGKCHLMKRVHSSDAVHPLLLDMIKGRYLVFSNGWSSFFKDLFNWLASRSRN